jgi:hypothetical protein
MTIVTTMYASEISRPLASTPAASRRIEMTMGTRTIAKSSPTAQFFSGTFPDKVQRVLPGEKKGEHRANQNELLKPHCRDLLKVTRDFRAKTFAELNYEFFAILRV